jgi:hypothetical protein
MLIRSISGVRGITPNHLNDSIIKSWKYCPLKGSYSLHIQLTEYEVGRFGGL